MATTIDLISTGFLDARKKYPDLYKIWINGSHRLGRKLPNSLLLYSVQKSGELDLLLRNIEDDVQLGLSINYLLSNHYLSFLSELWVFYVYEIFRILNKFEASDDVVAVFNDLELLRVSLAKHELPKDKKLVQAISMQRYPKKNDATDNYQYSKEDAQRSHIMPTGISPRGSVMWCATNVIDQTSCWIERLELSDRIINIFITKNTFLDL